MGNHILLKIKAVKFNLRIHPFYEIFVPKIPSFKVVDLASAVKSTNKLKFIGIRPGEKLHEIMCPKENAQHTIEFAKYFIIKPTIEFRNSIGDYDISKVGEKSKKVDINFEYSSGTNNHFLTVDEIKSFLSTL